MRVRLKLTNRKGEDKEIYLIDIAVWLGMGGGGWVIIGCMRFERL